MDDTTTYRIDVCEGDPKRKGWNVWHRGLLRFPTLKQAESFDVATYDGSRTSTRIIRLPADRLVVWSNRHNQKGGN